MYISKKTIALEPTHFLSLMKEIKFSKSDSISIQKQINKNNTSNFRYSFFAGKIFLGDSLLHIEKHKDGNTYLKISKPFFFEKGKKVWIFVEEYCPDTCGGGNIEIYEKSSQGYKLIGVVPIWIS